MLVRFGDTDPAGLVYYPNLFHYFHIAMEEFFRQRCGLPYHELIASQRIGFPTVNVITEFNHPLVYGDEIEIEVTVAAVGNSSVTLEYRVLRELDGAVCAHSRQTHVTINLDSRRPLAIPESLRKVFYEELAEGSEG